MTIQVKLKDIIEGLEFLTDEGSSYLNTSPPYTFFLLNGDMELNRNRHLFV